MNKIFFIFLVISIKIFTQNVGQPWEQDSIINYVDINQMKQGWWVKKYPNNQLAYVAYFRDNKLVGEYKRWYPSGVLMAHIIYNNDGSIGYAKFYWDNGKIMAKGKYINQNLKDSVWEYYGTDGYLMMKETFKNGILDGISISYYRNAKRTPVKIAEFKNGKLNGVYKEFFEDSIVKLEIYYKDGLRNGPIYVYHPNGSIYISGYYKNDLSNGIWRKYDKKGNVVEEWEYIDGLRKDDEKYSKEFAKKVKEWEKIKGKIPEPSPDNFFKDNFNPYVFE